jgi:hypothetical protein
MVALSTVAVVGHRDRRRVRRLLRGGSGLHIKREPQAHRPHVSNVKCDARPHRPGVRPLVGRRRITPARPHRLLVLRQHPCVVHRAVVVHLPPPSLHPSVHPCRPNRQAQHVVTTTQLPTLASYRVAHLTCLVDRSACMSTRSRFVGSPSANQPASTATVIAAQRPTSPAGQARRVNADVRRRNSALPHAAVHRGPALAPTPSADRGSAGAGCVCPSPRRSRCTRPGESAARPAHPRRPSACRSRRG